MCVEKCDYVLEQLSMGRQPTRFRANILVARASSLVGILTYSRGASSGTSSGSEEDDALSSGSDSESSSTVLNERGFEYSSTNAGETNREKLDRNRLAKTALKSAKEALLLHANNVEAHVISHDIYLLGNKRMKAFESIRLAQMLSPEDPIIARKVQKLAKLVSAMNRKTPGKKKGRYGSDVASRVAQRACAPRCLRDDARSWGKSAASANLAPSNPSKGVRNRRARHVLVLA